MAGSATYNEEADHILSYTYQLADRATFRVHPNPFVGAVIYKNGRKISEGWHQNAGGDHAEVIAIKNAREDLQGADIYVSLEPCSTTGKTPPCTDLIIKKGIKRVFFGAYDCDENNSGRAARILNDAGIEVIYRNFEKINNELNRSFIYRIKEHKTYISLKAAISLDGCLADAKGLSKWISCDKSRERVHLIRKKSDAVLVGANTFNIDNPLLNIRIKNCDDEADRIILTRSGELNTCNSLLSQSTKGKVLIITTPAGSEKLKKKVKNTNVVIKILPEEDFSLKACLTCIHESGYYNILVEGGSEIFGEFIQNGYFNEINLFISPTIFGRKGLNFAGVDELFYAADEKKLKLDKNEVIGNDVYLRYLNVYRNN